MAASSAGSLRWVIGLPIFIAFTCCLVFNAASQLLENANPTLAATLNPLNTDARVNALVASLNAGDAPLDQLAQEARALVALSSADARGYSLVGAIEERRTSADAARAWFEQALKRSKSERYALSWQLRDALSVGDDDAAVAFFDLLMRRWPELSGELLPVADTFVASGNSANALANALLTAPPWRSEVILHLITYPAGALFATGVLMADTDTRPPSWFTELSETIAALINHNLGSQAYALFLHSLGSDESSLAGYVYDSGFESRPGRTPFEWRVQPDSSVDLRYGGGPGGKGLLLRFLDSPAKLGSIAQNTLLVRGAYTVSVNVATRELIAPKGLYFTARCRASGKQLFRVDIPVGTADHQLTADFDVPDNCQVQLLTIQTDASSNAWRDRYRGEVLVDGIAVQRRAIQ